MTARSQRTQPRRRPPLQGWQLGLAWVLMLSGLTHRAAATPAPGGPADAPAHVCRAEPPRPGTARGFLGYACRDDRCGSHKAGFDWAERNGVADARACQARNDVAFTEGCRAFADETVTPEQAGFQWARENDLSDPCLCAGAGPAFEAGCEAWVRGYAD